jgi:uncharacterized protein YcfL
MEKLMIEFERAFEAIAEAMVQSAEQRSTATASSEAERHGLVEQGDGAPSQTTVWQRTDQDLTLWFRWHWYDQSAPFSIQPDMNVLSLELRQGDTVLRQAEQRYLD